MTTQENAPVTGYFIDSGSEAEIVRLIDQDHVVTEQLGLFPLPVEELFPLRGEHEYRVLDLACGPGGWASEAAFRLPEVEVIGVDLARPMVRYATMRATMQQLSNVRFSIMDVTHRFSFPDRFFDYIQARFLVGFLTPADWLPLVQECRRVLAPGGTLCLIESEWPLTSSPAYERLTALTSQALFQAGRSLSPDGRHFGVTPLLTGFLRNAGFEDIQCKAVALDWSIGSDLHASSVLNAHFAFALLEPFLHSAGVIDEASFTRLYTTMLEELHAPSFGGLVTPLVVWGTAPTAPTPRARTARRGEREPQEPRLPKTEDTRPSFKHLLDQYQMLTAQLAEMAGVGVESADALATGHAVLVEHIDALLTALSTATGETWNRVTVGHLHIRTDIGQEPPGEGKYASSGKSTPEGADQPP